MTIPSLLAILAPMKKEVFLAIAIGFALGLVITFGIWTANKSLKNLPSGDKPTPTPPTIDATPIPSPSSSPTSAQNSALTILSPADEALVNANKVTVTGKASPDATVSVQGEDGSQIVLADSKGDFSVSVNLVAGYNLIRVTAYDKSGNMTENSLTVTYSTASI